MRPQLVLLALVAALGAGCKGDNSQPSGHADVPARVSALKASVLQPGDLPPFFVRFDEGVQVRADLRGSPTRFGRLEGWKARYRRPGSRRTRGPLVIESRVDLFDNPDGARKELEAYARDLPERLHVLPGAPGLGDGGFTATGREGTGQFTVRLYLIAWREGDTTASVFVNGFEGKIELAQAVALARKQQRRMEAPG